MLATLIIRCPLIRLGWGLCSAHTYSCEGGTSLLDGTAYRHESGVIAKRAVGRSQQGIPKDSLQVMCTSFGLMWVTRLGQTAADVKYNRQCLNALHPGHTGCVSSACASRNLLLYISPMLTDLSSHTAHVRSAARAWLGCVSAASLLKTRGLADFFCVPRSSQQQQRLKLFF